ncbi:serine hydrolase domain-containing protein [Halobaculum rarum]|uniref:serine hydrolase domain-containing protein n=1 Tax=Halobaculum rarum TaxID=3075122 RepID=UPI0032AF97C8
MTPGTGDPDGLADNREDDGNDATSDWSSGMLPVPDIDRRHVLRILGGTATAAALGMAGWAGRAAYLTSGLDRTDLATAPTERSRATGPGADAVPGEALLAELDAHSERRDAVGLQATVRFNGGTSWRGVAGNADHDDGAPLSFDSQLYVGSVTKLFTAALTLRHVDLGVIGLDDSLEEWVDLAYADEVTVRMLLNHTSGVPSYTEDAWFIARYFGQPTRRWQPAELIDPVRDTPPKFDPGSRHEYSNTNYALLGLILERATGTSYGDLLAALVREELGYDRTYYLDYSDDAVIANAYDESIFGLGRRNLTGFRTSLESGGYAAGGVLSTAPDVAGFLRSLIDGRVLTKEALEAMRTFVDAPDEDVPTQRGYGLGLRRVDIDGEELIGHTGTIPGYSAVALHHDDPPYTMAVLSNVSTIDQSGIAGALQSVILDRYY